MSTDAQQTAGVVGTGLIGGSIAAGLASAGWRVIGHDGDQDVADRAIELGLIDHHEASLESPLWTRRRTVAPASPSRK